MFWCCFFIILVENIFIGFWMLYLYVFVLKFKWIIGKVLMIKYDYFKFNKI